MSYEKLGFVSGQKLKAEHLNHIEEGIANAGESDWNASEGEAGYILNRTHYEKIEIVEVLPETTIASTASQPAMLDNSFTPQDGKIYIVNLNGKEYTCAAGNFQEVCYIGNISLLMPSLENTNEPFFIFKNEDMLIILVVDGTTEQTISIIEKSIIIQKLDKKYMPSHDHSYLKLREYHATMPIKDHWKALTYGNDKFVSLSFDNGRIAYSEDGVSWVEPEVPFVGEGMRGMRCVAYGNGRFVAVSSGNNSEIMYSDDGITWNEASAPDGFRFSVAYGNGKFVITGIMNNEVLYSEDGINWNETMLPSNFNYWRPLTYGNGKFITLGTDNNDGNHACYSEDGINWSTTILPLSKDWNLVVYGNNKFVAFADNSDVAVYSDDGITWTQTTLPKSSSSWLGGAYGNGKFVVLEGFDCNAIYSMNGITWHEIALPTLEDDYWQSITYGNGKFVVTGHETDKVAYSEDGINWQTGYTEILQDEVVMPVVTENYVNKAIYDARFLTSPSGKKFALSVDDDGNLTAIEVI